MRKMPLKVSLCLMLILLLLSGCSQIAYSGKIYQPPGDALHYIELSCTYRTPDLGCADAVSLSGMPNDGEPDTELNRGIWWVENDNDDKQTIKIQWSDGHVSYISGEQFSIDETDDFYE